MNTNTQTSLYTTIVGKNYPEQRINNDEVQRQLDIVIIEQRIASKAVAAKQQVEIKSIEQEFRELAEKWYMETLHLSSYWEVILHPAYQSIIGLGRGVIPFILHELKDFQAEWFWALQAITRVNPVTDEQVGKPSEMAKAWINWGKENGYL